MISDASQSDSKPIVIIGFGGHGQVVAGALLASGHNVAAATDYQPETKSSPKNAFPIIRDEEVEEQFPSTRFELALGVGGIEPLSRSPGRRRIAEAWLERGYRFTQVHHPRSSVDPTVVLAHGAQLHCGSIVQVNAAIGRFSVINTGSIIEHDCVIGDFVHISPGAVVCGNVTVHDGAHVGAGAIIRQGIKIGRNALVGAGAVVVRDVADDECVVGVPARPMRR